MKIVADEHIPYIKEYFAKEGDLTLIPGRAISHAAVKAADILLVRSVTQVDQALLANTNVKFVGSVTAGADHLDTEWLDEAHIAWRVATGFNAPPVADYVVSVMAALQRKQLISQTRGRVAVIGVGHVGKRVAEKLKLLNYDVLLCDPIRAESENDFLSTKLEEIADVDLISLHVPLTRNGPYPTYHFIDKYFLSRQKRGTILINAARGSVIHSEDLMQYGAHLHWCFDVWENEPTINKTMLDRAFIATPHIAGYSVQSKIRGIEMIYRLACEEKIITSPSVSPIEMPKQVLRFAGENHHWQDVVMGIFNPLVMTAMMRNTLLPANNDDKLFDVMRNQFNYRHELAFTQVPNLDVQGYDRDMLQKLGMILSLPGVYH